MFVPEAETSAGDQDAEGRTQSPIVLNLPSDELRTGASAERIRDRGTELRGSQLPARNRRRRKSEVVRSIRSGTGHDRSPPVLRIARGY